MGNISIWQLLIVALIVILLFGTKKLRGIGGDLGGAVKGFKKAMSSDDEQSADASKDKALEANKEAPAAQSNAAPQQNAQATPAQNTSAQSTTEQKNKEQA